MSDSFVKTYHYDNGEIQRVQVVTADSFDLMHFFSPKGSKEAYRTIVNLYRNFIVPKCPWVFGRMILFYVPEEMKPLDFPHDDRDISEDAALCDFLRKNVKINKSGPVYKSSKAEAICQKLIEEGCLEIVCGKLPRTKLLPVGNSFGFLSQSKEEAKYKVNSHFFIMDCFDVASIFDRIGTPIGLSIDGGKVINPPSYDREAFLVYSDGKVEIKPICLREFTIHIGDETFIPGNNSGLYERPSVCRIPKSEKGQFLVITGRKVAGVFNKGGFEVPSSGYVLKVSGNTKVHSGDAVEYECPGNVKFAIQVGNSIMVKGKKTTDFVSKFYNIYKQLGRKAYPPTLYPLDFGGARAARTALGADRDGKPYILWAEGSKKTGYVPGEQSCGASLSEMADIAEDLGLFNAVNMDGGGSAQILVNNERHLILPDRNPKEDTDAERAVPMGICMEE